MFCYNVLEPMRHTYPRLYFVSDELLLEGLALSGDPSDLPPHLLDTLFQVGGQ